MLTIRLQRAGKRNSPDFRIVLAERKSSVSKKFNEVLGNYNPRTKQFVLKSADRVKYWLDQHVMVSPTVQNLFISQKVMEGKKTQAFKIPKKSSSAEATEDRPAPAEAPVTVAEAPVETSAEAPAAEQA